MRLGNAWRECAVHHTSVCHRVSICTFVLVRCVARVCGATHHPTHIQQYEDRYTAVCGHIYSSMRTDVHTSVRCSGMYICPHTSVYVSSYGYICVLRLLYIYIYIYAVLRYAARSIYYISPPKKILGSSYCCIYVLRVAVCVGGV